MPILTEWVAPDLAFRLRDGRPVFHCYEDDEGRSESPTKLHHYYTLSAKPEDEDSREHVVDFRDYLGLPWGVGHPQLPEPKDYVDDIAFAMCVLQRAVDEGLIWPRDETIPY